MIIIGFKLVLNCGWTLYSVYIISRLYKKDRVSFLYGMLSIVVFLSSYRDIVYWNTLASISLFRYIWGLYPLYLYSNIYKNKYILYLLSVSSIINCIFYFLGIFLA